ncbi:MAG: hypothetical protein KME45_25125 [Stenomitos rutilans HA7619-LM2]|jgi:hypothetical protein|nr:hypothetical protein [Stenomitos rutilans HA7619-LM2]
MKTQWQRYKELELLPEGAAEPQTIYSPLIAYLDQRWRSLLNRRAALLDYEYQVEYLERRLSLPCSQTIEKHSLLRKLWHWLNQPINFEHSFSPSEPEIQQTLDRTGQTWWKVYDPLTGQTAYLESEAEVHIWLEERLYH